MVNQYFRALAWIGIIGLSGLLGCGSTATDTNDAGLSLSLAADFTEAAARPLTPADAAQGADNSPYPRTALTPTAYSAAFQRLSAIRKDGTSFDWFISPTLRGSLVIDFLKDDPAQLIGNELPIGIDEIDRLEMVIYYLQLRIPIAGQVQTVRVYLSDDEVAGEGQHHQGDITQIDGAGNEVGWVTAPYFEISPERTIAAGPQTAEGPASIDPITGHQRGLFGNLTFWNTTHPEDAYLQTIPVADSPLLAAVGDQNLSLLVQVLHINDLIIRFDVGGTWVFHDVNGDGQFTPTVDTPGPANHPDDPAFQEQTGWGPQLPAITVQVPSLNVSFRLSS